MYTGVIATSDAGNAPLHGLAALQICSSLRNQTYFLLPALSGQDAESYRFYTHTCGALCEGNVLIM